MLDLNDVTLRIAGRPLLEGASLHLPAATRFGLVGRNGTGKSTLLRLIAGELQPDQGEVRLPRRRGSAWCAQEAPGGELTPLEAVLAADTRARRPAGRGRRPRPTRAASPRSTTG